MNFELSEWHLITSEYPPQGGGVSDYVRLVAAELAAAGDRVNVWCPPVGAGATFDERGVVVHRECGGFAPADLRRVGRLLEEFDAPRRLLVQYVPHGFGYRSMNVMFCAWLWKRAAIDGDHVEVMVHEPYLLFGGGTWRQKVAATMHRLMTMLVLRAARRVWMSIPAWEQHWRPYALGKRVRFEWLPTPSTVPVVEDAAGVAAVRARYAPENGLLVGHFGTYGERIAESLAQVLPALVADSSRRTTVLLLGRGGLAMRERLVREHPASAARIHATGALEAGELSRHLAACDLLVQPYPDGVSSRRTSVMAALAHGLPVATTSGHLSEKLWAESRAVALAPAGDAGALIETATRLLTDAEERRHLGARGRALYGGRFSVAHTVAALREAAREVQTASSTVAVG